MASPEHLSRRHRFQGREAFSAVLSSGKRLHAGDLTLVVSPSAAGISRFGVAVGRRVSPKATVRNRLKRVAREAFRRHAVKREGLDLVVLARAQEAGETQRWARALGELLDRASKTERP